MIYILIYGSVFSPILPIAIALFWNLSHRFPFIVSYLIFSFTVDIISLSLAFSKINTYPLIHIFGLVEFCLLIGFSHNRLKWNKKATKNFLILIGAIYAINSMFHENVFQFNSIIRSCLALIMIFISLRYFHRLIKFHTEVFIEKVPEFWFYTAILTYFSMALFSYILSLDILSKPIDQNLLYSWAFHNIANILKNILFAIGLWKVRTTT